MKRMMAVTALALVASFTQTFADDGWFVTGTNSDSVVMAAPVYRKTSADAWSAQTYPQGAYVKTSTGAVYWTPSGGVSTTEPSHSSSVGTASYDLGNIWWYRIDNGTRRFVIVYSDATTGEIAYSLAGKAPVLGGDPLDSSRLAQIYDNEQREIYVKGKGVFNVVLRK